MRRTALTLSAAALSLAVAAVVHAGPPGSWTPVTSANLVNIDQVGLARTADGLHVVWLSKNGNKEDLRHTTILPSGTGGLAHNSAVVARWSSLSNASIVVTSSGLQAFWAGIRSTSTTDPYSSGTVFTATAGPAGSAWSLAADPAAAPSSAYASDLVAATVKKDGTPVTAWSGTPGFYVHDGLDKAKPNVKIQAACCAYQASLATDQGSGEVYAAWYSNAAGSYGIHVRRVLPSLGGDHLMPGSASADRKSAVSPDQAVGIVSRDGAPGVCAAYGVGYPVWKALNVWCSGRSVRVWSGTIRHFTVAPALDGRVWALWTTGDAIYAARSNGAVTVFGASVEVAPPAGTTDIWKVEGDGRLGPTKPLDLLASVTKGGGIGFWHTQVEPGLTLLVEPGAAAASKAFKLLDAGDPVHGGRVQISGPRGLALPAPVGTASASGPAGSYTATASAPGYTDAKATFVVPHS